MISYVIVRCKDEKLMQAIAAAVHDFMLNDRPQYTLDHIDSGYYTMQEIAEGMNPMLFLEAGIEQESESL